MTTIAHFDNLSAIVGASGITRNDDVMLPWLTDWRGEYSGKAMAMVSPTTTREVAAIVEYCAANHLPIVPQGGNSGMVAGATPDASGDAILLSLRRMTAIDTIDMRAGLVKVEGGVILQNLHEAVASLGWRFPLTLGGRGSATVGGLISTNAGGTQVLRHGTMRALVAGIEAVLPDGSVINDMAALAKDNRGYSLRELLIGAEGTLGIVTKAVLKLVPAIKDRCVAWVGVSSLANARALLHRCQAGMAGRLEAFEVVPHSALQTVLAEIPGTRASLESAHDWYALIEIVREGDDQSDSAALVERVLGDALAAGLVSDAVIAANETQAEALWRIRESISEAERSRGLAVQHDISVPVSRMAEFVDIASDRIERAFPGCECMAFGHLGDGNVHFHVRAPANVDNLTWKNVGLSISSLVYDIVDEFEGSLSAEHGIGRSKVALLPRHLSPSRLAAMRAIKTALDPFGIMNPGALLNP